MKLRNKKTGEYGKFMMCHDDDRYPFYIETTLGIRIYYSNFEKMLEAGWEAYVVPKEPLIKDEKIRKAVRAWAEANNVEKVDYWNSDYEFRDMQGGLSINFEDNPIETEDRYGNDEYTIAELCGEEEE